MPGISAWDKMLAPFGEQVASLFRGAMGLGGSASNVIDESSRRRDRRHESLERWWEKAWLHHARRPDRRAHRVPHRPRKRDQADAINDLIFHYRAGRRDHARISQSLLARSDVDEIIARRAMEQADEVGMRRRRRRG